MFLADVSVTNLLNFSDFFLTVFFYYKIIKTDNMHNANVEGYLRMSNDIQRTTCTAKA